MKIFATCLVLLAATVWADDMPEVDDSVNMHGDGTDDDVTAKAAEEAVLDGFTAEEMATLRESSEQMEFQAEVNRMMKLIINSLYKNKDIFLRELISNASDALDKIRFMSLTDDTALQATEEMSIKIKVERDANVIHITDTGVGMTQAELKKNLGTIAKSGTSDFFENLSNMGSEDSASDLIGQFGVGFYSAFLVADKVVVTSKANSDDQYVWESDSVKFSVAKDPRGNTLERGTTISLYMKEEAGDYLQHQSVKDLIQKYSQFINFPIYLWSSKTIEEEEPIEEDADEEVKADDDEEAAVEDEEEAEEKPKTRKVTKTVWDWELINSTKPIWQRGTSEITDEEYDSFYKAISKESSGTSMARTHFNAEGEVSFKAILFVPNAAERDMFNDYGQKRTDNIKMYVRRVFITDDFTDMMPKYLQFVRGVVDSDDLPLNVSRETLQQHKLLKVIKKKLVRKALDMIKKIDAVDYLKKFWKEYSTNVKLGVIEDHSNRTRLAKLLRFLSSHDEEEPTSLEDYIERMKDGQEKIYFCGGNGLDDVKNSPFTERLLKKGYEVLYLTEPVDEYAIQALPEFDGKRFQNVAKEGVETPDDNKNFQEKMESKFEPLLEWIKTNPLREKIDKAIISQQLESTPAALQASQYGWDANMERIMKAQAYNTGNDASSAYYAKQKKTLLLNPRHPLVKTLLEKVEADESDEAAIEITKLLFDTAALRSGYSLREPVDFADRILNIMYANLEIDPETPIDDEPTAADFEDEDDELVDEEEVDADAEEEVFDEETDDVKDEL